MHRFRHEFVQELVVFICASVLFATFYYMFEDFVNTEISRISNELQHRITISASVIFFFLLAVYVSKRLGHFLHSRISLKYTAERLGESPQVVKVFTVIQTSVLFLFATLVTFALNQTLLYELEPIALSLILGFLFIISLIFAVFIEKDPESVAHRDLKPIRLPSNKSVVATMVSWRLKQILLRNRAGQFSILIAGATGAALVFFYLQHAPKPLKFLTLYAFGLFSCLPLFFQLASDLKLAWAERYMGVSHEQVILCYKSIALLIVGIGSMVIIGSELLGKSETTSLSQWGFGVAQNIFIFATPLMLAPGLLFQVDAHRPAIQILALILLGLFIATAIYWHLMAVLLWPAFNYYSFASQSGRYYRV